MAATPKPIRKVMKKMSSESRDSGKEQHKGIKKENMKMSVKKAKSDGKSKRSVNFAKSQY